MRTNPNVCKTCPFHGGKGINLSEEHLTELYRKITQFESTHICHTTNKHHCRGGRQIQAQIAACFGFIGEATPEALQRHLDRVRIKTWVNARKLIRPNTRKLRRPQIIN